MTLGRRKPSPLGRIVAAFTVGQLGWWFALVALQVAVYNRTHNLIAAASVLVVGVIPALFAPAVVARVELSRRRGGLAAIYVVQAACGAVLAAVVWQFSLPAILLFVILDGSVAYAGRALLRSLAATEGERSIGGTGGSGTASDGVHRANAALNISLALCGVIGPALAATAVAGFGAPIALLIEAGCFLASATLVLDMRPHVEEAKASVRARLAAARQYLRSASRLRALIVTEVVAMVFFYTAIPVEVGYTKTTLHSGDLGYGALLAAWGVGMVVGSLLFTRAARWLWAMLVAGTLAVGFAYIGYAAAPSLAVACVAAVPGGIGNGVQWAAFLGIVQELTPRRLLGRVMGVVEGTASIAPVLGYALGGVIGRVSPRLALLTAGASAVALAASFLRIGSVRQRAEEPAQLAVATGQGPAQQETGVRQEAP